MQAYSLSKRLKQEYPNDEIEIINYRRKSVDRSYEYHLSDYLRSSNVKELAKKTLDLVLDPKLLKRMRYRTRVFNECQHRLPISEALICSDGTDELYRYIEENYDVLVVGSDAVWNFVLRGFPNAYFPKADLGVRKLSYAASCYGMDFKKYAQDHKEEIRDIFSGFDFLGVRDGATEQFVEWTGCEKEPQHTCDPTVFLDVNDLPIDLELLHKKLEDRGFDFEKPAIGIMGNEKMLSMVRAMYGKQYQIVSLYNYLGAADVNLYDLEPYEWAYVFRYFKVTFTTYFHGTLLSLRNGVPVVCIDLGTEFGKHYVPKTLDVLGRLGFEDWYFKTDYKTINIDKIKSKADELILGDYYKQITEVMDNEAKSFEVFNSALLSVMRKDTEND